MSVSRWLVLTGLLIILFVGAWYGMIRMPGKSFSGVIPPISPDEQVLEQEMRAHVFKLAGEIGERNVFHYDKLVQAAEYIRATFQNAGYEVRRQEYQPTATDAAIRRAHRQHGKSVQNFAIAAEGMRLRWNVRRGLSVSRR